MVVRPVPRRHSPHTTSASIPLPRLRASARRMPTHSTFFVRMHAKVRAARNVDRLDLAHCRDNVLSSAHSSRVALDAHWATSRQYVYCTFELATARRRKAATTLYCRLNILSCLYRLCARSGSFAVLARVFPDWHCASGPRLRRKSGCTPKAPSMR
jgi:hypothetical protein